MPLYNLATRRLEDTYPYVTQVSKSSVNPDKWSFADGLGIPVTWFDGTASYAMNAGSASYALTASFALNAGAGGGGTPAPPDKAIQFNSGGVPGVFDGDGSFLFDYTILSLNQGLDVYACGSYSHAQGNYTFASGNYSHAEGYNTTASGEYTHTEGIESKTMYSLYTLVYTSQSLSTTTPDVAILPDPVFFTGFNVVFVTDPLWSTYFNNTYNSDGVSYFMTVTVLDGVDVESYSIDVIYDDSAGLYGTPGYYLVSYSTGINIITTPILAICNTTNPISLNTDPITGSYNLFLGDVTGHGAHAEGWGTISTGTASHAEGGFSSAYGTGSHAEGSNTIAVGDYSHTEGWFTVASSSYQHVTGRWNKLNNVDDYFVIGDGTDGFNRSDAFGVNAIRLYASNSIYFPDLTEQPKSHIILFDTASGQIFFTASNQIGGLPAPPTWSVQFNQSNQFGGDAGFTFRPDLNNILYLTGSMVISGSGSDRLTVIGSGSGSPVQATRGTQGELFTVTDRLTGSLFSVRDISGIPVMNVYSDDSTTLGSFRAPGLYTSVRAIIPNTAAWETVYIADSTLYDFVMLEYTAVSLNISDYYRQSGLYRTHWTPDLLNSQNDHIPFTIATTGLAPSPNVLLTFRTQFSGTNILIQARTVPTWLREWTFKSIIRSI